MGFPILTALVVLPVIGAIVVALLPRSRPEIVRIVGLLFTVAVGAMSVWLLASFKKSSRNNEQLSGKSYHRLCKDI